MRDLPIFPALLTLCLLCLTPTAWAAHAYAQFGDVKYPAGFTHFDYVNPAAPKGGEIRMVPPTRPTNSAGRRMPEETIDSIAG